MYNLGANEMFSRGQTIKQNSVSTDIGETPKYIPTFPLKLYVLR